MTKHSAVKPDHVSKWVICTYEEATEGCSTGLTCHLKDQRKCCPNSYHKNEGYCHQENYKLHTLLRKITNH